MKVLTKEELLSILANRPLTQAGIRQKIRELIQKRRRQKEEAIRQEEEAIRQAIELRKEGERLDAISKPRIVEEDYGIPPF